MYNKSTLTLVCNVTGNSITYTNKAFIERKLANNNNDEAHMRAVYVCKDAQKLLAMGKTVAETIEALKGTKDPATVDLSKLMLKKMMPLTRKPRQPKETTIDPGDQVAPAAPVTEAAPVVEETPEPQVVPTVEVSPEYKEAQTKKVPMKKAAKSSKKSSKKTVSSEIKAE